MPSAAIFWTLTYDPAGANVEKSLADWNIKQASLDIDDSSKDMMQFTQFGVNMDDALTFATFKTCIIQSGRVFDGTSYSGGKIRFYGLVISAPRYGSGDDEYIRYKLAGPWWYFENLTMQISFQVVTGGTIQAPTFTPLFTSHFVLNRDIFTRPLSTGETVETCVNFAISKGAPIALLPDAAVTVPVVVGANTGTITVSQGIKSYMYVPNDEVNTITVAQCIKQTFNWTPDIVQWFDYTTNPPTFMCQSPSANALPVVNVALFGSDLGDVVITSANIDRRDDLLKTFVLFNFEQVNEIGGMQKLGFAQQLYPVGFNPTGIDAFRGVDQTVTLSGANFQTAEAVINTTAYPSFVTNASDTVAWFKDRAKYLSDSSISSVVINSIKRPDGTSFMPSHPFELRRGSFASWMKGVGVGGLSGGLVAGAARKETILVNADVNSTAGGAEKNKVFPLEVVSTNVNTSGQTLTLTNTTGSSSADFVPPNLAQDYYNATNIVQWEGEITISQKEADAGISVGNALNITDSPTFANMNATVRSISIDIDAGKTVVKFGPNKLRTLGTLIDLLRVTRSRIVSMAPTAGSTGDLSGDSSPLPDHFPPGQTGGGAGGGYSPAAVVSDNPNATNQSVQVTAAGITGSPANTPLQFGVAIQNAGDALIVLNYGDCFVNGGKVPIRFRKYDVCVTDANGTPTVMQAIMLGSLPFAKP